MPAVDWAQVVNVAWGVFIGLTAFAAVAGSLYVAASFGSVVGEEENVPLALFFGGFIWLIALPVSLIIGAAIVAVMYGLSLGVQWLLTFIHV